MRTPIPPFEKVIVAGSAYLEAEGDREYENALAAFRQATQEWMRAEGWRPPAAENEPESSAAA